MKSISVKINEIRSLKSYIGDQLTVGGTVSDKILLFDIDETLISSNATIKVIKDREVIKKLDPQEFNTYKLNPGESFDFEDFNSFEGLIQATMLPYFKTLKKEYSKGTHIGILTARADGDMIKNFLLTKGIDIKDELIFAINDPKLHLHGKISDKKAEVIELLYYKGYKTFVFFDDSEENLKEAKKLERKLKIKIHTVKA